MDLIRISTAGSVDDGKSTLIGRLLLETKALKTDQLEHIRSVSASRGMDYLDLSLATDGLISEREQGITIDVSHIYLNTSRRRYILADAPGHEEYTRNMVTASSSAHAMIILLDATKGITLQTRRHFYIAHLLRIPHVVLCVNKMDLVNYDSGVYAEIQKDFMSIQEKIKGDFRTTYFIPVSALLGDNISTVSEKMPWYQGPSLIEVLDQIKITGKSSDDTYFQSQYIQRVQNGHPSVSKRWILGKLTSGEIKVGDEVIILPGDTKSRIAGIHQFGAHKETLLHDENGSLLLEDEVDVSRGSIILKNHNPFNRFSEARTDVCWMDKKPLIPGALYIVQQGSRKVKARVKSIHYVLDLNALSKHQSEKLELNDIGQVTWTFSEPLYAQSFHLHKQSGAFIVIDPASHNTIGVCLINP